MEKTNDRPIFPLGILDTVVIDDEHFIDVIQYVDGTVKTYYMEKVAGTLNEFKSIKEGNGNLLNEFLKPVKE